MSSAMFFKKLSVFSFPRPSCFSSVFLKSPIMWTETTTSTFCHKDLQAWQIFSTFFPSRSSILRGPRIMMISLLTTFTVFVMKFFCKKKKVEHYDIFCSSGCDVSRIIKLDGKCHRGAFRTRTFALNNWGANVPSTCFLLLCPSFQRSSCFYGSFV